MDVLSWVIGVGSLIFAAASALFAYEAANVGRLALKLAQDQAAAGPKLELELEHDLEFEEPWPDPPRQMRPTIAAFRQERADSIITVIVHNSGNRPANGVHGWVAIDANRLRPVDRDSLRMPASNAGWSVDIPDESEDGEYEVGLWAAKITPGTRHEFEIPVQYLRLGDVELAWEIVCDEGLRLEGRYTIEIRKRDYTENLRS